MLIPFDTILIFVMTSFALGLAPGPDNIFVLTQSALLGRKAGLFVTLGLCTGLMVHTAAVALGVAVLFQTSALAFSVLKFVGAGYLLYLAYGAFRAGNSHIPQEGDSQIATTPIRLYRRGIIMNITNPKVAIFFLAFLPQFTSPANGMISVQMLMLGGLFIITTLCLFSAIAFGAGYLGDWLRKSAKAQRIMNRIAGLVFVALAMRLILIRNA